MVMVMVVVVVVVAFVFVFSYIVQLFPKPLSGMICSVLTW